VGLQYLLSVSLQYILPVYNNPPHIAKDKDKERKRRKKNWVHLRCNASEMV